MNALSHIGIAVGDLEAAIKIFSEILECKPESIENIPDQKIRVAVFKPGGNDAASIELICPTADDSPVKKSMDKRGAGLHHISIRVPDLSMRLVELRRTNLRLIDESPRTGAEGKQIAFIHPSSTSGVLIELEEG